MSKYSFIKEIANIATQPKKLDDDLVVDNILAHKGITAGAYNLMANSAKQKAQHILNIKAMNAANELSAAKAAQTAAYSDAIAAGGADAALNQSLFDANRQLASKTAEAKAASDLAKAGPPDPSSWSIAADLYGITLANAFARSALRTAKTNKYDPYEYSYMKAMEEKPLLWKYNKKYKNPTEFDKYRY